MREENSEGKTHCREGKPNVFCGGVTDGAVSRAPFPCLSAATHTPSTNGLIPFKGQLRFSNEGQWELRRDFWDAERIPKFTWDGKGQTLVAEARGLTLSDVKTR